MLNFKLNMLNEFILDKNFILNLRISVFYKIIFN